MKLFNKHILFVGRVVAFLFFVASSGFTTILHICSMESSECCDTSGASDHQACPSPEEPSPLSGTVIQNADDCHINAVVGGLSAIQALLQKESHPQKMEILSVILPLFVPLAPDKTPSHSNYSYSQSVSPPSVEKYVLNETFLI